MFNLITEIQNANNGIFACLKSETRTAIETVLREWIYETAGNERQRWVSAQM